MCIFGANIIHFMQEQHLSVQRTSRYYTLWAGYFANGITDVIEPSKLAQIPTTLVYGTQDEFLVQIDLVQHEADIQKSIPYAQVVTFDGKHTIDGPTLKKAATF